jgi:two-component system chemotaxis response regulator CheY
MRRMIIRTLKLSGLPVGELFEADNGREGLLQLAKNRIDLALVDINMPVMNGEEMIKRIKQDPNLEELPIVVVSTKGSSTRIADLESVGVGFVHKPFTPESLSQVVFQVTEGSYGEEHGDRSFSSGGPDF